MNVPIRDDRYFMQGVNFNMFQNTPLYTSEEYECSYPLIESTYPQQFSINMLDSFNQFLTTIPPEFVIPIEEVIDLACFYYNDWENVVAVADEFIDEQVMGGLRECLEQYMEQSKVEIALEESAAMLATALRKFLTIMIGVLSRANLPAIMDYGCCYRLNYIDNNGIAFFKLMNPSQIFDYLEGNERQQGELKL